MNENILVIAAHPDDEVLGCGGALINHKKKKDNITVIILSDGESSRNQKNLQLKINNRKNNAIKVSKIIGYKNLFTYNYPDNQMDNVTFLDIVQTLEEKINYIKPNKIYTHYPYDLNIDHQITSKAVTTATRPLSKHNVQEILFFEIPSSTEWAYKAFKPNLFINIEKNIEKKMKLLNIYKNEMRNVPHPRSLKNIKNLAMIRGSQSGLKYAEAFKIYRKILK
tara:strand:+ start:263 stop:931 length:669 start_codon:yes stop_codon:yes gene_type:complete